MAIDPNQSLLQSKNQSPSDLTPAPLSGPSHYVRFALSELPPPSHLYIGVDDSLAVTGITSQTAEVVTVNARLLLTDGRIEDMQFVIRPSNTRAVLRTLFPLAEGFLLSVSASAAVAVTRGQTFVRVGIQRAASGANQPSSMLMADYVTTASAPGFPNGRILTPTETTGWVHTVTVGNPAAGADWSAVVPTNTRWRVISFFAQFQTSATVATRAVSLAVTGGGQFVFVGSAIATQLASLINDYSGAQLTPYTPGLATILTLPIPPNLYLSQLSGGTNSVASQTNNLQAGDQWSNINVLVEEWLDNV
jgi:hypothetical protein